MLKVGVSGLHGGTVGGLSMWIKHPFFSNSAVLTLLVGSAFGMGGLVSTGDWERFGKSLGVNILTTGGAYAGGLGLGFVAGALLGLETGGVGLFVRAGSLAGGHYGRKGAVEIPCLGGMTDHEVQTMYASIKKQLSAAGMEPDPSLSPAEVVTKVIQNSREGRGVPFAIQMTKSHKVDVMELKEKLAALWRDSPTDFDQFLSLLRAEPNGEFPG